MNARFSLLGSVGRLELFAPFAYRLGMAAEEISISELAQLVRDDALLLAAFDREYAGPGDAHRALDLVAGRDSALLARENPELARLAFGRPDPAAPEAHVEALRELKTMSAEREAAAVEVRRVLALVVEPATADGSPEVAPRSANALVLLTIALLVIVGVVLAALKIPAPSFAVFDRPQSAEEARLAEEMVPMFGPHEADLSSVRILGRDEDMVFLAVRVANPLMFGGDGSGVCMYHLAQHGGGGGCSPTEDVRKTGVSGTSSGPSGRYTYSWGPTGPLVFTRTDRDNSP